MDKKRHMLLEGPIVASLITLAIPIVVANLLQSGYQLTDAFWVGRLGGTAVAAMSVVFPISFLAMALGMGFSIAASTLVAQFAGAGKWEEVKHTASQSMFVAIIIGLFLGGLGYILAPKILALMNVPVEVYPSALSVMRITFMSMPLTFIFITYQSLMRGVGDVMRPLYIVLTAVCINAVVDPLFIYGWGPIPALGVSGAAVATFITQAMSAIVGLASLVFGSHGVEVSLKDFSIDGTFIKRLAKLGIPTSAEQTVRAMSMTVMTVLVTGYGTVAVAAYGVGSSVMMVVIIPALGMSMAVAAFYGQNIGAGKPERAREAVRVGIKLSFTLLATIGVLTFFFAPFIVQFFISSDAVAVSILAVSYIKVISLTFGLIGLQMVYFGVFRAAGSPGTALVLTFISQWVIQFPLAYVLSRYTPLGVSGIWWSVPLVHVITVLLATWWYLRGSWQKQSLTAEDRLVEQVAEDILIEEGVRS